MKFTISYLRYAHGIYNALIILLFLYQGGLGFEIRKERLKDKVPVKAVKNHRRFGPVLSMLGLAGFISGLILTYVHFGRLVIFTLHFAVGLIISILIVTSYLLSRKIKSRDYSMRTAHLVTGAALICLYFVQAFLGAGILF